MEENCLEGVLRLQVLRTDAPTVTDVIDKFAHVSVRRLKCIVYSSGSQSGRYCPPGGGEKL